MQQIANRKISSSIKSHPGDEEQHESHLPTLLINQLWQQRFLAMETMQQVNKGCMYAPMCLWNESMIGVKIINIL